MSLPPPAGFASWAATFTQLSSGRTAVVTCGCNPSSIATAAGTLSNMSNAFFDLTSLYAFALMDTEWELTSQYVLLNQGGVFTSAVSITNNPGTLAGATVTPNVSGVMKKSTSLAGRQYRGRQAIPSAFLPVAEISDEGIMSGTLLADLQGGATSTLSQATSNGVPLVLLHGPSLTGPAPAPTTIDALTVSALVGTQRRRLRR